MSLEIKTTCPLGSECEKVADGHIERCAWYVAIKGDDPQTGELIDEWRCAMAWQPILLVNSSRETNRVADGVHQLRSDVHRRVNIAQTAKEGLPNGTEVPAIDGVREEGS